MKFVLQNKKDRMYVGRLDINSSTEWESLAMAVIFNFKNEDEANGFTKCLEHLKFGHYQAIEKII